LCGDAVEALQQGQRHAIDLRHRLERARLGMPDEGVGLGEIRLGGRGRRQPFDGLAQAFQFGQQLGREGHGRSLGIMLKDQRATVFEAVSIAHSPETVKSLS
jgi:hypothetical protein